MSNVTLSVPTPSELIASPRQQERAISIEHVMVWYQKLALVVVATFIVTLLVVATMVLWSALGGHISMLFVAMGIVLSLAILASYTIILHLNSLVK